MWAVVPLKCPDAAKSRLGTSLSPLQRRQLVFILARRVLAALAATPGIDHIAVVTASQEVARFAQAFGAETIWQEGDFGTARAFAAAVSYLQPLRLDQLLMIAGDLPLITPQAVQHLLLAADASPGVVIAPDIQRIGSNALLCTPPDVMPPCFGVDSFYQHLAAATALGLPVHVMEIEELALDLDVAADLDRLRTRVDGSSPLGRLLRGAGAARHSIVQGGGVLTS